MKALVLSGGGSKGAFAGGIAEYLINDKGEQYDIYVGSSVGSLLISHLALNNIPLLKKTFTSVNNKDIYNISPFRVKIKGEQIITKINHFNTLRAFLKKCNTFGQSKNLKKLINKTHIYEDFQRLKKGPQVFFTVSNITLQKVEYIHANECTYDDYCDMMWASANLVPFMSLLTKNGYQYADGGFGSHVPVLQAIKLGATDIDVIILDKESTDEQISTLTNPFQSLMGVFRFMSNQSSLKDVLIGKLQGVQSRIDIKLWYAPENLTDNPLYFNAKQMTKWWEQGYQNAKKEQPICHCFLADGSVKEVTYKQLNQQKSKNI